MITEQDFTNSENLARLVECVKSGEMTIFDVRQLTKDVELTEKTLYHILNLAELVGKTQIRQRVKEQTENMLYWVNQN